MAPQLPPEILYQILGCLFDDLLSLRSAVRLSKIWAEHAISMLWEKPLVSGGRHYGSQTDTRGISANWTSETNKGGQQHAHFHVLGQKLCVGQYIQPALEDFTFYGAQPEEDLILTRLGTLELTVDSKAVKSLAGAIGFIRSLTLLICDTDHSVLPLLGSLVHLRELELRYDEELNVLREDLLAPQGLRHLELFKIDSRVDLWSPTLTDQDVTKLWASWVYFRNRTPLDQKVVTMFQIRTDQKYNA
ncbi:hypothetical protein P168DRAFT_322743 [Aspergillus campestris IBT 28561]|uniref:Uncharacterized protein n=1 Tax=Aspergillus campestris (strain IBT 28561) TaxID=1392248 RepID=A0A2I1CQT6_ASPC2|nr:uncharacterized protein P168DRAFT_322743 [Aspergillus campestris IBT 28561]PKX99984.1 hypothetical protein P168DRAFT_322743 [Aspergillus campestris IBT 28561]